MLNIRKFISTNARRFLSFPESDRLSTLRLSFLNKPQIFRRPAAILKRKLSVYPSPHAATRNFAHQNTFQSSSLHGKSANIPSSSRSSLIHRTPEQKIFNAKKFLSMPKNSFSPRASALFLFSRRGERNVSRWKERKARSGTADSFLSTRMK
jgi:hypothetical protein